MTANSASAASASIRTSSRRTQRIGSSCQSPIQTPGTSANGSPAPWMEMSPALVLWTVCGNAGMPKRPMSVSASWPTRSRSWSRAMLNASSRYEGSSPVMPWLESVVYEWWYMPNASTNAMT